MVECPVCETANLLTSPYCDGCGLRLEAASAISADIPASFLSGRYQVKQLLGEGANKIVYKAFDVVLERDVALAWVKREGWGFWKAYPAGVERILKEARFMARLGDHPNIVSVYDAGEEDGQAFLISQLMTGGDLEGLLERAPGRRFSVERALTVTGQILDGLDWAHQRGVIHRDLKPGNVWIDEEGTVKIGDLGLACGVDRSALTTQTAIVGTVAYMAPEQATGEVPDERSDLYSVGAILYCMLAGRPPFVSDDTVAVIDQHLNATPVAPNWHNRAVPRSVDRLVQRLLAKDPELRPQSAAEARAAVRALSWNLSAGDGEDSWEAVTARRNPMEALSSQSFVGRERELGIIRGAFGEAARGSPRGIFIAGEPGIGKTRLAEQAAVLARLKGFEVLWGRVRDAEGRPYQVWAQVVGSALDLVPVEELVKTLGPAYAELALITPDVLKKVAGSGQPASLDPEQARQRLFDAVARLLDSAAEAAPLAVVLEDLHWADPASHALLRHLMERLRGGRVVVLATFRDLEVTSELRMLLEAVCSQASCERLQLEGLQSGEINRFLSAVAGWEPPERMVQGLEDFTGGNPFLLGEVVKLLMTEEDPLGVSEDTLRQLPSNVDALFSSRLGQLSSKGQEVLQAAAVLGRQFENDLLGEVTRLPRTELDMALAESLERRVIEPGTTDQVYQFVHALFLARIYEGIEASSRVALHARAAQALQTSVAKQRRAGDISHHLMRALPLVQAEEAARFALLAGNDSLAAYAFEDAARHFEAALALGAENRLPAIQVALLHRGLGDALVSLARREDGIRQYTRAIGVLEQQEPLAPEPDIAALHFAILLELGIAHVVDRQFEEALSVFSEAQSRIPTDATLHVRRTQKIPLQLALAETYYHAGDLGRLEVVIDEVAPEVEEFGTPEQHADLLAARIRLLLRRSRYRPGSKVSELARRELALRLTAGPPEGDLRGAYFRMGLSLLLQGEYRAAEHNLEAGLKLAGQTGDRIQAVRCCTYLSMLHRLAGDRARARTRADEAIRAAEDAGQAGYAAAARATKGWLMLHEGYRHEAQAELAGALTEWGSESNWPFEWLARAPLAALAAERGEDEEAKGQLRRLLHRGQQELPPSLASAVRRVLDSPGSGDGLAEALQLARELNYA